MQWKIWYNNGTVISGNSIQEWIDAPITGVLGVYEFIEWSNGLKLCNLHCYGDWYWMEENGSIKQSTSNDSDGNFIEPNNPNNSILKQGGMTGNDEMLYVYSLMLEESKNGN